MDERILSGPMSQQPGESKWPVEYLIRKENDSITQKEPIFYTHAENVGYSATGKWIGSDLPGISERYNTYRSAVRGSYNEHFFEHSRAVSNISAVDGYREIWFAETLPTETGARLDFYGARYLSIVQHLKDDCPGLGTVADLIEPRQMVPPAPSVDDIYEFASIERNTSTISSRGPIQVSYLPNELWTVKTGDVVVSGIDVVHGAVAVAGKEVDGLVMSKEMYAYRTKKGVLPEFAALMLRTDLAKLLIHGKVTGTSNRTRISSALEILDIPIPKVPSKADQEKIAKACVLSKSQRQTSTQNLKEAEKLTGNLWGINIRFDDVEEPAGEPALEV